MAADSKEEHEEDQEKEGDLAIAETTDYDWPLVTSSQGFWDGECFYLRSFSVFYRWWVSSSSKQQAPESGTTPQGVEWHQSMGKIELWYPIQGMDDVFTEADLLVELSGWELKVSIGTDINFIRGKSQGKQIAALCGELFADVRRQFCWWELVQGPEGGKWIAVYLSKLQHRAWGDIWYGQPLNPHRRTSFHWNTMQARPEKLEDDVLSKLEPGEPQELSKQLCTGVSPERLCTGVDQDEDEFTATLTVHLDEEAVQAITAEVPMEELFSADVRSSTVEVFLRSDSLGICFGTLKGLCLPELTTWRITSARRRNLLKEWGIRCPAFYNPVLQITLTKADGHQGLWGGVFADLQTPAFDPPKERESWTERVQRALVLSPGAPLKEAVKAQRALKMCTSVESMQDTVTQRVTITFHLDASLEELAHKFKVDLTRFFTLKVGERMLEVCVVADAEFTMVVGEFGGPVVPDKTTWEIVKEKASPNSPQETLALKLSLIKGGDRERWENKVFRKMEKWEVSERMREAQQAQQAQLPPVEDNAPEPEE